jgi:hypothetical protein
MGARRGGGVPSGGFGDLGKRVGIRCNVDVLAFDLDAAIWRAERDGGHRHVLRGGGLGGLVVGEACVGCAIAEQENPRRWVFPVVGGRVLDGVE